MNEAGALAETVVFLKHFEALPDPRQSAKVIYRLEEILLLCLLAALAGAETFVDIATQLTKHRWKLSASRVANRSPN